MRFLRKSDGYKHKISKFRLKPLRQRGYAAYFPYVPHKTTPLENRDSEICMGINAEKIAPPPRIYYNKSDLKSAIGLTNSIVGGEHSTPGGALYPLI